MEIPANGAIGFCRSKGLIGRLIRLGERLRFRKGIVNHAFIVHPSGKVWQAEARGVTSTRTLDEVAPGGKIWLLPFPEHVDVERVFVFCEQNVGKPYGWLTIFNLAIDIITPKWFPAFRSEGSWICSALVAEALRTGGWVRKGLWPDIYTVTPQQLKDVLDFGL